MADRLTLLEMYGKQKELKESYFTMEASKLTSASLKHIDSDRKQTDPNQRTLFSLEMTLG